MGESDQSQWQLLRRQYLGEISALCFLRLPAHLCSLPLLLAGTGSQILVYDLVSGKIIRSFPVFEGIRVHGISVEHFTNRCRVLPLLSGLLSLGKGE
ncbi:UNVERIFIED_CONTAM: hypothetical protein Slati_0609400 [Sesamum latifolium]|uniref:Uncharacterized protein n=1 Tax=Sesamum latifolium TaxID=2727402 RepID=A0AAW2Y280_9LAMI